MNRGGGGRLAPCLSPDKSVVIYRNPWLLEMGLIVPDGTVFVSYNSIFDNECKKLT